jgi:hypothetical protein
MSVCGAGGRRRGTWLGNNKRCTVFLSEITSETRHLHLSTDNDEISIANYTTRLDRLGTPQPITLLTTMSHNVSHFFHPHARSAERARRALCIHIREQRYALCAFTAPKYHTPL